MLQLCRWLCSLGLATNSLFALRWVSSEHNPADEPSRRFSSERDPALGPRQDLYEARHGAGAAPSSREAIKYFSERREVRNGWLRRASKAAGIIDDDSDDENKTQAHAGRPPGRRGALSCFEVRSPRDSPTVLPESDQRRHHSVRGEGAQAADAGAVH